MLSHLENSSFRLPSLIRRFPSAGILKQSSIDLTGRQMYVSHNRTSDEDILDAAEVGVFELVEHGDVVELDVEVLVDGFQGAADGDVVLELDGYGMVCEGLKEAGGVLVG